MSSTPVVDGEEDGADDGEEDGEEEGEEGEEPAGVLQEVME